MRLSKCNNDKGQKRIMYIEPCAGLGNRMSALVSAFYWADKYNMDLRIVWKHEDPCAVDYYKIFDEVKGLTIKEINQMGKKQIHILQFVYANLWLRKIRAGCRFFTCEDIRKLYKDKGMDGIGEVIEKNLKIYIKATSIFANEELLREKGFYYKFPFKNELNCFTESIMKDYQYKIGIHIRRTDHIDAIANSPTFCLNM